MKLKIILFSLILIMSLFLVCAFESPVYHIGVEIPSDGSEDVTIEITEPVTSNLGGGSSNKDPINNFSDSSSTDDDNLGTGNEFVDLTSGESEQENKGFFPRITGAVIGALGTGGTIGALVFVLGILGTVIFIKFKKRKLRI